MSFIIGKNIAKKIDFTGIRIVYLADFLLSEVVKSGLKSTVCNCLIKGTWIVS